MNVHFFDRDLSWLSFNERVLEEAGNKNVPLLERVKFLAIFSSNLDEFYRVRMPVLMSKNTGDNNGALLENVRMIIGEQQQFFGKVLSQEILPGLEENNIHLVYNKEVPGEILEPVEDYFFSIIAAFLQIINLSGETQQYFSENNKLYQVAILEDSNGNEEVLIITVPSDKVSRFFSVTKSGIRYIVFIDDIIRQMLPVIVRSKTIKGVFSIKITRDAGLDLEDEIAGNVAEKIESKIADRDLGYATRFLYEPGIPLRILEWLTGKLQLPKANIVRGGRYHNLKDFSAIPINDPLLSYPPWPVVNSRLHTKGFFLESILQKDQIVHTPYQSYNGILRFFSEAAIDSDVEEIYVALYRIAGDSKIANALITAANNGKQVMVFVELKARFDEANNIKWAKLMKAAGIKIIYSIIDLKVHAKIALVKKRQQSRIIYLGLFSTGNLNESTAKFYTDHILFTAHNEMLMELESLFLFLGQKRKPLSNAEIEFKHLLVAQFNLQTAFFNLIDHEIKNARQGLAAGITIKLNNLEEEKLINKLYEASAAGVPVNLVIRSICCLKPGQPGIRENIRVTRIVDRYLEHGRVFIFNNNNNELIFLGSADWMNRNIYSRVEVCFPVYDEDIKKQIRQIIDLQLADNVQAVEINKILKNVPVQNNQGKIRSQEKVHQLLMDAT